MPKQSDGLILRGNTWHFDKKILGQRIRGSAHTSDKEEALVLLSKKINEVKNQELFGARKKFLFKEAATKYLNENLHLASISDNGLLLKQLMPFIGNKPLHMIHIGSIQPYIDKRKEEGISNKRINLAIGVVTRILRLAAKLWRDDDGLPWLDVPPLLPKLPNNSKETVPLSFCQERRLMEELPEHIRNAAMFSINTGCRMSEIATLKWDRLYLLEDSDIELFVLERINTKTKVARPVVLNSVIRPLVDSLKNNDSDNVFVYNGKSVPRFNTRAWRNARGRAGLPDFPFHGLRHTFAYRARQAGIPVETRKLLLGHSDNDITTHYSAPNIEELYHAVEAISKSKDGTLVRSIRR